MIVDTSYILDLLDGDREVFETGQELVAGPTPLKIPTMTIVELFVGYGATANQPDEPVLTRNVEDFERIDGVEITTY
jgi:predicted nucleic acid-binding protein